MPTRKASMADIWRAKRARNALVRFEPTNLLKRRLIQMEIVRPTVQEWCIPIQYTSSPEIIKNCLQEVLNEGMLHQYQFIIN